MKHPSSTGTHIVSITVAIFLLGCYGLTTWPGFTAPNESMLSMAAFLPQAMARGEWWRLLSYSVIHANGLHLFSNLFGIVVLGQLVEPALGTARTIVLFLLSVVMGGFFVYFLSNQSVIGASAIDYGLMGAYMMLVLAEHPLVTPATPEIQETAPEPETGSKSPHRKNHSKNTSLRGVVAYLICFIVMGVWYQESYGISFWGHLGGLIAGISVVTFWPPAIHTPNV
ncbi:MAG: rhomboid family intramembrane serine protease [Cyanobacteria bacterium]|nr:rhomboid family intramembrane serine protease [Cyanobacteriota bacterium]